MQNRHQFGDIVPFDLRNLRDDSPNVDAVTIELNGRLTKVAMILIPHHDPTHERQLNFLKSAENNRRSQALWCEIQYPDGGRMPDCGEWVST